MSKPWRLTPQAEESLIVLAFWTIESFGTQQAERYEDELIDRCDAISTGTVLSRSCAVLLGHGDTDLRYARAGEHFVVFLDAAEQVVIVDFLHSRSDLPRHIAALDVLDKG